MNLASWMGAEHIRDFRTVEIVEKKCLFLTTIGFVLLMGFLISVKTTIMPIGSIVSILTLIEIGYLFTYKYEIRMRKECRAMRLALPNPLAEGINAADNGNIEKMVNSIYIRTTDFFEPRHLAIFDCIISDMLDQDPTLRDRLLDCSATYSEENP